MSKNKEASIQQTWVWAHTSEDPFYMPPLAANWDEDPFA